MKPLRLVLIGLVSVVLLLVVVTGLAFTPAMQTWAARKLAPSGPELAVRIDRVAVGLGGGRLENVRIVRPGLVLTIPSAEIEAGLAEAAGGRISVGKLVAKGWTLDLSAPSPAPASSGAASSSSGGVSPGAVPAGKPVASGSPADAARTAFNGLFELIRLPFDLSVDGVDLAGEVILPQGRAHVEIGGGGVAAGRESKFTLTGKFSDPDANTATLKGDVAVRMDTPRSFDRLGLSLTLSAKGRALPKGAELDVQAQAAREERGETYFAAVRSGSRELARLDAKLPPGTAPLAGVWKVDVNSADAAATGPSFPDVVARGSGTFEAGRDFSRFKAAGSLDASADKLGAFLPELAGLGRLRVTAGFDASVAEGVARLDSLDVRIAGEKPVLTILARQPVAFDLGTHETRASGASPELLTIRIDGLPLAWAKPFLRDISLIGDDVRGEFVVSAEDGGFAVQPVVPVSLGSLSIARAGRPLLDGIDAVLTARATYSPKGFSAVVDDLAIKGRGAPLLKLTAKLGRTGVGTQPIVASGRFEADLPAVLAQPVATGTASLARGTVSGGFDASLAESATGTLTLQLAGLAAADATRTPLPAVAVQARVTRDASGRIDANAPVVVTQAGRRSDLTLAAVLVPKAGDSDIRATVSGDSLYLPDLSAFAAVKSSPPAVRSDATRSSATPAGKSANPTPAPSAVPVGPLWAGLTGEARVALKKVVQGPELEVNNFSAVVKITPDALTLQESRAALKTGGDFKASGGLGYDAKQAAPYGLKADMTLADVDAAPLLRAFSPGQPAPVEGRFTVTAAASGRAADPAGLAETAAVDVKITGQRGVFRALSVKTGANLENAGKVAAIAGLIGAFAGSESTVKYAGRARAAADVAKQFAAIPFDRFSLVAGRGADHGIKLKDLSIVSSLMKISGSGSIAYEPGVPVIRQPLRVDLKIAAKDAFAENLRILKLETAQPDADGYAPLVEDVTLDGTLQAVGTAQLSRLLNRALSE